jgi:hypothetical protein
MVYVEISGFPYGPMAWKNLAGKSIQKFDHGPAAHSQHGDPGSKISGIVPPLGCLEM